MNKKIVSLVIVSAVAVPLAFASAQGPSNLNAEIKQQRQQQKSENLQERQNIKADKQQLAQDKCKNIETRISNRVNNFENNQTMFQTVFGNMKARLDRLTSRLDSAGADTTKLKADIVILNGKIDKLNSDYASFIDQLKQTQTLTCGQSQGEFMGKLGDARKQLPLIMQDKQDIKTFFQGTIKPDLLAIRQKLAEQKTTTTENTSTTTK